MSSCRSGVARTSELESVWCMDDLKLSDVRLVLADPRHVVRNSLRMALNDAGFVNQNIRDGGDADGFSQEANDSATSVADGQGIAGGALSVVGGILRFAPTPQTVMIGSGLLLLASILLLLAASIRVSSKAATGPVPGLSGSGGGGGGAGGLGTGSPGCSPASPTRAAPMSRAAPAPTRTGSSSRPLLPR